jgi:putative transposase
LNASKTFTETAASSKDMKTREEPSWPVLLIISSVNPRLGRGDSQRFDRVKQ